jgi:hypothetical protein
LQTFGLRRAIAGNINGQTAMPLISLHLLGWL